MTSGRAESRGAPRGSEARPPIGGAADASAADAPSRGEAVSAVRESDAGNADAPSRGEAVSAVREGDAGNADAPSRGEAVSAVRTVSAVRESDAGNADAPSRSEVVSAVLAREVPREGEPSARAAAGPSTRAAAGPSARGVVEPLRRADAIVVLGCRVLPWGRLTAAAEGRAAAAAEAWRAGLAPRIVTSGGRRWGAQVEAVALRDALVGRGVPAAAILVELWSMTTYENAVFSAALLRGLGARTAVVVTCSWHAPRALMSFRSAGVEVTAWPRVVDAGAFDRVAEGVRRAVDARTIRRSTVLSRTAAAFFRPLPPRSP